jgi:hypothetical protein
VEAVVEKRGEALMRLVGIEGIGTPTPTVRNERKRKAPVRWEPPLKA